MKNLLPSALRLLLLFGSLFSATPSHGQSWQWATAPGGGVGYATATDAAGNVYVTGQFSGTVAFGTTTLTANGSTTDVFVAKLNSSGVYQWAVKAGGTGDDQAQAVAVDGSGNVYVAGYFLATGTFGATTLVSAGISDAFVAKLTSAGVWQWAVRAGGTGTDEALALAVDGSGNVYTTGWQTGTSVFGATNLVSVGGADVFVAKLSTAGAWQWAVRGGSTNDDQSYGLAVDGSGNVYIDGSFGGTATFGATASIISAGSQDLFVAKLSGSGVWQWASRAGGLSSEYANALAVDGSGAVYITGFFYDTVIIGATTLTSAGSRDVMVAKLTPAGAWQWATSAGGAPADDTGYGVVVDAVGSAYVTGGFYGTATFGTTTLTSAGGADIFAAKLTPAGAWQWAVGAGGARNDYGYGIAADASGNVSLTGYVYSPTANFGPLPVTNATGWTALFSARLTQIPTVSSFLPATGTPGVSVTLTGTNLRDVSSVTFGGVSATSFTVVSATSLTAVVPTTAVTGTLAVTTPYGTATSAGTFTVYSPPSILSFTPGSGPGGTSVVLYGANLTGASSVKFNSVAATFTVNSATQITATVPVGATTGPISITTPGGAVTSAALFTVTPTPATPTITAFTPTSGARGTVVTVTGTNLTGASGVTIGGANATFTPVSATQLTVVVPPYATTGRIQVANAAGASQSTTNFTLTAAITGFAPASGPTGAAVAVLGRGFMTANNISAVIAVSFNGASAAYTVVSDTLLTTTVPVTATTGLVRVATAGSTVASTANYTVLSANGIVFDIDSVSAMPGAQVVVPVRVRGFTSMLGLQGTLRFNPAQLTLVGVEQFNAALTGLTAAQFNTTGAAANGQVSVAYFNSTNTPITLADNSAVFAVRFTVPATAAAGSRAPLWWAPGPVPVEATLSTGLAAVPQALGGAVLLPAAALISGTVRTGNSTAVPGVTLSVSGPLAPVAAVTPAAGTYALPALVSTGAYTLTPSKTNDVTVANGVTVTDLALIQRHILGTSLLGVAYKAVSADVNGDAAITVADVAAVQSLILGTTTSFTGGKLWRFYTSAQVFVNPNSPWPLTQTRTYASLAAGNLAQDFVACKLGDVNDSWNPAIPRPAAPVTADTLRVGFPSMTVAPAGHFRLPLTVDAGPACGGLQGELAWDPAVLRLVGIATTLPGLVVGVPDTAAGHLPVLWTDPAGQPLHGPATLLELEFEALSPAPGGATPVTLVDGPRTALLALDAALAPLTLHVAGGAVSVGPLGVASAVANGANALSLWPNPAHETVRLTGAPGVLVTVCDALGRPVRTARLDGNGAATLALPGLPAGVYAVRAGRTVRRLVVE